MVVMTLARPGDTDTPDADGTARRSAVDGQVVNDLDLQPAAMTALAERYLLRDEEGRVTETPGQMMDRVAEHVAQAEGLHRDGGTTAWEERFAALMHSLEFLPNSPTLMNAGTPLGVLSGCFVLPLHDSLQSIFDTLRTTALLHQAGAGTGFSFSHLRPRGDVVSSSGGIASGPVSFVELYDSASEVIRLGGRRRGANMAVLDASHPDVETFISAKSEPERLATFNLSVAVSDEFMRAAEEDRAYGLVNPRTGRTVRRLSARQLLRRIAEQAWHGGEPGLLFTDAVNQGNPLPNRGRIEATNPCGEVPLAPFESCNLGSVNLARFVTNGRLDESRLREVVRLAVRFLDDVIDVARYPEADLETAARDARKIGLGVMGLAETLAALGLAYDSFEAVRFCDRLMYHISAWAYAASRELAAERGPFPLFAQSRLAVRGERPLRNAQLTSVAPTGTISLIAGTTAGIEPMFALTYTRHVLGRDFTEVNPLFERVSSARGLDPDMVTTGGTVRDRVEVPVDLRRVFVTAHEVAPKWHVRMQAAVQRHVDAAVAKTVNLPETATIGEVEDVFWQAWRAGVKGITVYRSESRKGQVLRVSAVAREQEPAVHVHGTYTGGSLAGADL
jgi:ribonucleoside-diphosphate reductase alpha chain